MHLNGIIIAGVCFLAIGIFHPIVIKAEYYFSASCWPVFLAAGLLFLSASMQVEHVVAASALGVLGCSCLWSILELKEQEKRVERGWFPENPKRKDKKQKEAIKPARAAGRPDRGAALQQERKDDQTNDKKGACPGHH